MKTLLKLCLILVVCRMMCGCSDALYVDPVPTTTIYLGGYRYYHPLPPRPHYHWQYRPHIAPRPLPPPPPGGGHMRPGNPPGRPNGGRPGGNPGGGRPGRGGRR